MEPWNPLPKKHHTLRPLRSDTARRFFPILAFLFATLFCSSLLAQPETLFELPVSAERPLVLNLQDAEVFVSVHPEAEDKLVIERLPDFFPEKPQAGDLLIEELEEGKLRLGNSSEVNRGTLRLIWKVASEPDIRVTGDRVTFSWTALGSTLPAGDSLVARFRGGKAEVKTKGKGEDEESERAKGRSLRGQLTASIVSIFGAVNVELDLENSSFHSESTQGSLDLVAVNGTDVAIVKHQGSVVLGLENAGGRLEELKGNLRFVNYDGDLRVQGGGGTLEGESQGGRSSVDGWRGLVNVTGKDAFFDVFGEGDLPGPIKIKGERLVVRAEGIRGRLEADITESEMNVREVSGECKLTGRAYSRFDIEEIVTLNGLFIDGTSVEVEGVDRLAKVDIRGSSFSGRGINRLQIEIESSSVDLSQLQSLSTLKARHGELRLDLTNLKASRHHFEFDGQTTAVIQLSSPCLVRPMGPGAKLGNQVTVTGCELELYGQKSRRKNQRPLGLEGEAQTRLVARLGPDSSLEVHGN